jgi:hypothetical protein
MIPNLSYDDMQRIARDGSPLLLQALGRVFGLGPNERAALGQPGTGGLPVWTWVLVAATVGFVVGARVQKKWPTALPAVVRGK